ncbi:hypothetical protein EJ04DRAFT_66210 [Polyplosphaeria fusca]|uniref:Telomere replication protein EST3 n=1 Tax=Polyplosphaeria fusca TaxID=682080 RepID=A0A9P4QQA1_9PLEO|nr:hypothetical protein EJ04DRAFT_66210 [Polyplosphaeria fusca]
MDCPLTHWLEESIALDLRRADSWLQKKAGHKQHPDDGWSGLFVDNGSNLDIASEVYHPNQALVQIIQSDPLVISDGDAFIETRLSRACRIDLKRDHPGVDIPNSLHGLLTVRKYTVRYTSYGPPLQKLQLILDDVAWHATSPTDRIGQPKHLRLCRRVTDSLRLLHKTREKGDCYTVSSTQPDVMPGSDPYDEENEAGNSTLGSQVAFGTQAPALARRQLQGAGVPLMSGHHYSRTGHVSAPVQPKNINPHAQDLLNVLNRGRAAAVAPVHSPLPQQPSDTVGEISQQEDSTPSALPQDSPSGAQQLDPISPPQDDTLEETLPSIEQEGSGQSNDFPHGAATIFGPNWMRGFTFDRNTATIPSDQRKLLDRPEAWSKPPPGLRFPHPNVPIHILRDIGVVSGGDGPAEPESAAESAVDLPDIDEDNGSEVSWSSSIPPPSPKPLAIHKTTNLPPDSSLPEAKPDFDRRETDYPSISNGQKDPTISGGEVAHAVPSSPPVMITNNDSDDDMETQIPGALGDDDHHMDIDAPAVKEPVPPSAGGFSKRKSVVQVKETPYPKTKSVRPTLQTLPTSSVENRISSGTSGSTSIVFGTYKENSSSAPKETADDAAFLTPELCPETGKLKIPSPEVDDVPMIDAPAIKEDVQKPHVDPAASFTIDRQGVINVTAESNLASARELLQESATITSEPSARSPDISMAEEVVNVTAESNLASAQGSFQEPATATGEPSPRSRMNRQKVVNLVVVETHRESARSSLQEPATATGKPSPRSPDVSMAEGDPQLAVTEAAYPVREPLAKRRPDVSPRKLDPRKLKKRGLKILGFEDSPEAEPLASYESKHTYAERKRAERSSTAPRNPSLDVSEPPNTLQYPQAETVGSFARNSPRTLGKPKSRAITDDLGNGAFSTAASPEPQRPTSIFDAFKSTYPQYTGNQTHFVAQCRQIHELELEDKMVPKWMWDDFIVRNRTDYKDYILDCFNRGEDPLPYHRFYKDHAQNTIYNEGIIADLATVQKASEQLGHTLRPAEQRTPPLKPAVHKPAPSDRVLPWLQQSSPAASQTRRNIQTPDRPHRSTSGTVEKHRPSPMSRSDAKDRRPLERSHHSLPNVPSQQQSPASTSQAPQPQPQPPIKSAGDPFRAFVLGQQKMTSWTGQTGVSRPSSTASRSRDREG